MECDPARAASLESLVRDRALTASNTGPPGQETHGPAGPMGPWRVVGQAGNSYQRHRATFSTNLLAFDRRTKNRGSATGFSAASVGTERPFNIYNAGPRIIWPAGASGRKLQAKPSRRSAANRRRDMVRVLDGGVTEVGPAPPATKERQRAAFRSSSPL
jgi:hypothetical protein